MKPDKSQRRVGNKVPPVAEKILALMTVEGVGLFFRDVEHGRVPTLQ